MNSTKNAEKNGNYVMRRSEYNLQDKLCAAINPVVNPYPGTHIPTIFTKGVTPHSWPPKTDIAMCSTPDHLHVQGYILAKAYCGH